MNKRNSYKNLKGVLNVTGSNINYYRQKKGWSAQQLSDKLIMRGLDLHRQAVFNIESGTRTVADYELAIISEVLGVSSDSLLSTFVNDLRKENNS